MKQIAVINTGGQYCHLIARRLREIGVSAQVCSPDDAVESLRTVKGVVISGGPKSVYADDAIKCPKEILTAKTPVLGICYGHHLLAEEFGAQIKSGTQREYGQARLEIVDSDTILSGLQTDDVVWMSHGDEVVKAPPGFKLLARTDRCNVAAMSHLKKAKFGLQFHPEVSHTPAGRKILENFLFRVCNCKRDWDPRSQIDSLKKEISDKVGARKVLFFVSGGVDSTVAFSLCAEALGSERVLGVFVDTGFMRKEERLQIQRVFHARGWENVRFVDARQSFAKALADVSDPEEKRRRIGCCFLEVQRQVAQELHLADGDWVLGQGTIYPDRIESGCSTDAATIKTHHNRIPEIETLIRKGLILEPLADFYKDEVRIVGEQLGLPAEMVRKHPFPGPGLAIRCICSPQARKITRSREIQKVISRAEVEEWVVPLRTVGVEGDYRSYRDLVVLSCAEYEDTLDSYVELATTITNRVPETNRVAILVHPLQRRALERALVGVAMVTSERLHLLREADAIAHEMLVSEGYAELVWQFPVVLLPLSLEKGETIALRPVESVDAMTARPAELPMDFILGLAARLGEIPGVDAVIYDLTSKPPGTIEWE